MALPAGEDTEAMGDDEKFRLSAGWTKATWDVQYA
jgi:hypothetical protein